MIKREFSSGTQIKFVVMDKIRIPVLIFFIIILTFISSG